MNRMHDDYVNTSSDLWGSEGLRLTDSYTMDLFCINVSGLIYDYHVSPTVEQVTNSKFILCAWPIYQILIIRITSRDDCTM